MDKLLLSLENITVRNYDQTLFEGLNLIINKGENWALIGESGAGKTALLETIAGKFHISKGQIKHPSFDKYIKDHPVDDPLFNWHHLVAQVSSRHHFRNLSNTSNFYYQQRFNSFDSEDAETVENYLRSVSVSGQGIWTYNKVIDRLNLKFLADKQLIKLSNGETKRLLLASVLIKNPVLLLLDNPLSGLDVSSRSDFNKLVSEITVSGISIIMATSPEEIPDGITHIAILEKGKILKTMPRSEHKAGRISFPGHSSVNVKVLRELLSIREVQKFDTIAGMDNVTIKYGDKIILDRINWQVKQGERWALVGHNGAGKSTLLSLINGDNPQAYANNITLFDRKRGSGESIWDIKKKIGFLSPELFQYFPSDASCLQAIESGFYDTLGLFKPSDASKRETARRWMCLLKIENSADKLFKNVSISIQRLCLIARALVKNPPLLIFDEPCQGLDARQQEYFRQLIDCICDNSNITLIYVSHYQHEIPASVTQILKLEKGKMAES